MRSLLVEVVTAGMVAHSKRAKRENRRRWNQAERQLRREAMRPAGIGIVQAAEMAVEEQDEQRERVERPKQAAKRARQTPMERYLARGEVTRQQYGDAEQLWSDYMRSGLTAAVTGAYGTKTAAGSGTLPPGCGPRYAEYQAAMRAVGIILSPVLAAVVLEGLFAGDWAAQHKRPDGEGIVALRLALDALGMHYRRKRS